MPHEQTYTLGDLIAKQQIWFMGTSSVMYRNVIKEFPKWFYKSLVGDIPKYILLAKHGKIKYLPQMMSVYFINSNGVSHSIRHDNAAVLRNHIQMYEAINRELGYQYDSVLKAQIAMYYRLLLDTNQSRFSLLSRVSNTLAFMGKTRPGWNESKQIVKVYLTPIIILKAYSKLNKGLSRQGNAFKKIRPNGL